MKAHDKSQTSSLELTLYLQLNQENLFILIKSGLTETEDKDSQFKRRGDL